MIPQFRTATYAAIGMGLVCFYFSSPFYADWLHGPGRLAGILFLVFLLMILIAGYRTIAVWWQSDGALGVTFCVIVYAFYITVLLPNLVTTRGEYPSIARMKWIIVCLSLLAGFGLLVVIQRWRWSMMQRMAEEDRQTENLSADSQP